MMKHQKMLGYSIVVIFIALLMVLYAALNSPRVIKVVTDRVAPSYHITYQKISGDFISGVKIEGIKYKQKPLCERLVFRWNPISLFYKNLSVSKITLHQVHMQNLRTVYDDLKQENEVDTAKQDTFLSFLIPGSVNIAHFEVTVVPITFDTLSVEKLQGEIEDTQVQLDEPMVQSGKVTIRGRSNLGDIHYQGFITNNQSEGTLNLSGIEKLIEAYDLPIRKEAVKKVVVKIKASPYEINTYLSLNAYNVLKGTFTQGEFNVDIERFVSKAIYDIKQNRLKVESSLLSSTPYAKEINVTNDLISTDGQITYKGQVNVGKWTAIDQNIIEPLEDMHITYKGDMQKLHADIKAKNLEGFIKSEDLKHFETHFGSINEIKLSQLMQLPKELEATQLTFDIDIPWAKDENMTQQAQVKLRSNVVDVDANVTFGKPLKVHGTSMIGEASLLRTINQKINWDVLSPMKIDAELMEENVTAVVETKAREVWLEARYHLRDRNLTGEIDINGFHATMNGIPDKKMAVDTHIKSFQEMFNAIGAIYRFEALPVVSGSANVSAKIKALETLELTLESPKVLYQTDTKTSHTITALKLAADINKEEVNLDHYTMHYDDLTLFATKPSQVSYRNDLIQVEPFWINDSMKVEGSYDYNVSKGSFSIQAKNFPLKHQYADLNVDTDLLIVLEENATSVNGSVVLLDGKIQYDLMQKSFPSDSDIIIVQEQKAKKPNTFMDNLSVNVVFETQRPLVYQKPPVDMHVKAEGSIYKAVQSPLMVLGMVTLPKGGSYSFQNKKFTLNDSYIYFSGDINKPLLELSARYEAHRHLIQVDVKGTPNSPNIRFSSVPRLTKEQILSVILFDSTGGAEGYSSDDMMRMMGGVMAKSVLSRLGLDVDLLSIGEDSSLQVGKKLSEDITVIYINDEVPKVELKYKHNERLESVVGTSSQSSSYDLFYKKDY